MKKLNETFKYNLALVCFVAAGSILFGCKKNEQTQVIPNVPVNVQVYVTDPQFSNLNAVGGWTYLNAGSRGILVYRKNTEEFITVDRHCTYQPENPCGRIIMDQNNITATDTCCGSQFLILDGSIQKGPATVPLKQYRNEFDGTVLRIYN